MPPLKLLHSFDFLKSFESPCSKQESVRFVPSNLQPIGKKRFFRNKFLVRPSETKIDPLGRSTVLAGKNRCFCTCRPFVRHHFSKQNKFQAKTMFATGETVGLAEWIIDDTCLIPFVSMAEKASSYKRA